MNVCVALRIADPSDFVDSLIAQFGGAAAGGISDTLRFAHGEIAISPTRAFATHINIGARWIDTAYTQPRTPANDWRFIPLPDVTAQTAIDACERYDGEPYDWWDLFAFLPGLAWLPEWRGHDFCSDQCVDIIQKMAPQFWFPDGHRPNPKRISPTLLADDLQSKGLKLCDLQTAFS